MYNRMLQGAAGLAALVVIGVGAAAIGGASSGDASTDRNAAFAGPGGGPPGMGTDVTGATADRVEAAALGKYPGTIERIEQTPDGNYVAHVIQQNGGGEVHVLVDGDFNVKGEMQRPAGPPPGMGPGGGAPPAPPSNGSDGATDES